MSSYNRQKNRENKFGRPFTKLAQFTSEHVAKLKVWLIPRVASKRKEEPRHNGLLYSGVTRVGDTRGGN